jgi:hypothetical protein
MVHTTITSSFSNLMKGGQTILGVVLAIWICIIGIAAVGLKDLVLMLMGRNPNTNRWPIWLKVYVVISIAVAIGGIIWALCR